jgi:hypothetical protein
VATHTTTHVQIGFANPYLKCEECSGKVRYWHNPDRCGCDAEKPFFNYPCEHTADVISTCPTWGPVDGCMCEETCKK